MRFSGEAKAGSFQPDAPAMWTAECIKLNGRRVSVILEREHAKRSNPQNSRFWVVIVPVFREVINQALAAQGIKDDRGLPMQLSKDEMHEKLEEWVLGFEDIPGVGKRRRHCSALSVAAFAEFMNECETIGRERFDAVFPASEQEIVEAGL